MNVGGGEAADQMVRMMLSGTEVMVRLSGSALKNMLALTMALASNRKVLSGKVNMGKMLRETRDLRRFPMTPEYEQTFSMVMRVLEYAEVKEEDEEYDSPLDLLFQSIERERPDSVAVRQYKVFKLAAGDLCSKRLVYPIFR